MSLLMWECGLKHAVRPNGNIHRKVTPYVGVWIETVRERPEAGGTAVTPYVGVWIETLEIVPPESMFTVTPYVGVWIETVNI